MSRKSTEPDELRALAAELTQALGCTFFARDGLICTTPERAAELSKQAATLATDVADLTAVADTLATRVAALQAQLGSAP